MLQNTFATAKKKTNTTMSKSNSARITSKLECKKTLYIRFWDIGAEGYISEEHLPPTAYSIRELAYATLYVILMGQITSQITHILRPQP